VHTIKNIAERAGVSTATVSYVINNSSSVTPEVRERVLRIVRELRFHPNAVARGLRTKKTGTVGMIVPDITNPFFPGLIRGAEDVLRATGYTLIVGNSDSDLSKEEEYYRTFTGRRVEGLLLIASVSARSPEYLQHHDLRATPVVFVDRHYRDVRADAVSADNLGGSLQAMRHLLDIGHQRIAIVAGPLQLTNARLRLEGYKRALASKHIEIEDDLIREGRYDAQSGFEQTKALLDLKSRPTALFVSNAPMTSGCLRAIRERGVRCPEELALVSFDDPEWFGLTHPSVSCVAQNPYQLGAAAAQILAKRIAGQLTAPPRRRVFKTRLVIRESSGCNIASPQ
jgi:DNA-binding LacI/PurR family transcriptional regulator